MTSPEDMSQDVEAAWREVLLHGHNSRWAVLPGAPRCYVCQIPVGGIGATVLRPLGRGPSRKNPQLCNFCDTVMPQGGAEVDVAVLFADIRGSTGLGERMGAGAFAKLLNRFYRTATEGLLPRKAVIDKMIGDEVMALFIPSTGPSYRRSAVESAEAIMQGVGYGSKDGPWLPLGIGVHAGPAYVGKVGTQGINDFTALGDTINTAARLQAEAKAGEIVLSEEVYGTVADRYPHLEPREVTLRGRDEKLTIRIIPAESLPTG